jgi:hypothetical protein
MNIDKSLFLPEAVLTEQIARRIFEVLSESGPLMVITDTAGRSRFSDLEGFVNLNISESFLKEICVTIDDGDEPVVTACRDCAIVAGQLVSADSKHGYVFLIFPDCRPESILANFGLIETVLNQISLTAELVETNSVCYEMQRKRLGAFGQSESVLN